ncbi:MAG TPA: CPBP family intramembrane metalloprotease [Fulvivirga sp.]|nr:CPBP family intramembrane metalloprotease [Fulvivirga sp.]
MLGIFFILALSWVLLHFIEKKNLLALGVLPIGFRLGQLAVGFVFISLVSYGLIYHESIVKQIEWTLNQEIEILSIFGSLFYHFKSAVTEELIFRGALLYILISKLGRSKALWLSAVCFGVYHWFSYSMFGRGLVQMTYVFVTTALMGYVWGYTFAKTQSIMLPLGLHLGWNFIRTLCYEAAPYGELIWKETSRTELLEWNGFYYSILTGLAVPIITYLFVRYFFSEADTPNLENETNR